MNIYRTMFFLGAVFALLSADVVASASRRAEKRSREEEPAASSTETPICLICNEAMDLDAETGGLVDQAPVGAAHAAHPMHRDCLAMWWQTSQTCPACRAVATDEELAAMGMARLVAGALAQEQRLLLVEALSQDNIDALDELLAQGFNVNRELSFGRTALIIAAGQCSVAIIARLLVAGANINHRDGSGETALLVALENNNEPVINHLLMLPETNLLCRNNRGKSTLTYAINHISDKLDFALFERIIDTPGYEALIRVSDSLGFTPLHLAACKGLPGVTQFLLNHGADPKCKNIYRQTPLNVAKDAGKEDVVAVLERVIAARKAESLVGALSRSKAWQDEVAHE